MMGRSLQQWYAFAVFSLRDFFRTLSSDPLYEWKAFTFFIVSESLFAMSAMFALATAAGGDALLQSRTALVLCCTVMFSLIFWAHATAEKRLLHRFEREFRSLSKAQRVAITVGVLLVMVLSVWAAYRAAGAAHAHLAGLR